MKPALVPRRDWVRRQLTESAVREVRKEIEEKREDAVKASEYNAEFGKCFHSSESRVDEVNEFSVDW